MNIQSLKCCSEVNLAYCYNAIIKFSSDFDKPIEEIIFVSTCDKHDLGNMVNQVLSIKQDKNKTVLVDFGEETENE